MCLVDWCGVALGARNEEAAAAVRKVAMNWGTNGKAQVLLGGKAAPSAAAMINGTMAHCLDYDDTHVGSTTHVSGPTVASALAVGTHLGARTGYPFRDHYRIRVAASRKWRGPAMNLRGFHATGIFGALVRRRQQACCLALMSPGAQCLRCGRDPDGRSQCILRHHVQTIPCRESGSQRRALGGTRRRRLHRQGRSAGAGWRTLDLNLPGWWCGTGVARFLGRLGDHP